MTFVLIVLLTPGIATFFYRSLGWTGMIAVTAIGIALLVYVCFGESSRDDEVVGGPGPVDDAAASETKQRAP